MEATLFKILAMTLLCAALFVAAEPGVQAAEPKVLYLQPLGKSVSEVELDLVRSALASFYDMRVVTLPRVPMPRETYVSSRKRYRADLLLAYLRTRLPEDGFRILGLTANDISTTKGKSADWGVMGLASFAGPTCVVSSYRCHDANSRTRGTERLGKVAVHEIGHTLGLKHCASRSCLMSDAKGSVSTVDHEFDLCRICRDQIEAAGMFIPPNPQVAWLHEEPAAALQ